MNIFEYAAMNRLRFQYKGSITTEDLYSLSVKALDEIYQGLAAELAAKQGAKSLMAKQDKDTEQLTIKMKIVEYIYGQKIAQTEAAKRAAAQKQQDQVILDLIAKKEQQALEGKSVEELRAMLSNP